MILKGSKSCIYSGDIDNSGNVDVTDVVPIYNDQRLFVSGNVKTDINGDDIVDTNDLVIVYNNADLCGSGEAVRNLFDRNS